MRVDLGTTPRQRRPPERPRNGIVLLPLCQSIAVFARSSQGVSPGIPEVGYTEVILRFFFIAALRILSVNETKRQSKNVIIRPKTRRYNSKDDG